MSSDVSAESEERPPLDWTGLRTARVLLFGSVPIAILVAVLVPPPLRIPALLAIPAVGLWRALAWRCPACGHAFAEAPLRVLADECTVCGLPAFAGVSPTGLDSSIAREARRQRRQARQRAFERALAIMHGGAAGLLVPLFISAAFRSPTTPVFDVVFALTIATAGILCSWWLWHGRPGGRSGTMVLLALQTMSFASPTGGYHVQLGVHAGPTMSAEAVTLSVGLRSAAGFPLADPTEVRGNAVAVVLLVMLWHLRRDSHT